MAFQRHPIEGENTRYRIVPQTSSVTEKQADLKAGDILVLMTNDCPIKKSCLAVDTNNMTCGCDYLGPYPFGRNDEHQLDSLLCKYNGRSRTLSVSLMTAMDCPQYNNACIAKNGVCRHLETVHIPWDLSTPHACVTCSHR